MDGYILTYYENEERYTISFKDSSGISIEKEITKSIYNEYKQEYLRYVSQEHKTRSHIEYSELSDNTLYKRARNKPSSIERMLEDKELIGKINQVFATFTEVQKRRFIKYYIEKKTYKQIAAEESCTYQGIENSMKWIIKKFKKTFKI